MDIDQFLVTSSDFEPVPVSGDLKLSSRGRSVAELAGSVTGHIEFGANQQSNVPRSQRRQLSMVATRMGEGIKAEVRTLQWGENELVGQVLVKSTDPLDMDVKLERGTLSLLPWEKAYAERKEKAGAKTKVAEEEDDETGVLAATAGRSAGIIGNFLMTPVRVLTRDEKKKAEDALFSPEPIDFSALAGKQVTFSGDLESFESSVLTARQLHMDGTLSNGQLVLHADAEEMNGGNTVMDIAVDSTATVPTVQASADFRNVRGLIGGDTYPRSGHVAFKTNGNSLAELAAGAYGVIYLELGRGPFDYVNSTLLTADLASSVFRRLVPGIEEEQPELECGVTLGVFENGRGVTPSGFALRTNQANILGRIDIWEHTPKLRW